VYIKSEWFPSHSDKIRVFVYEGNFFVYKIPLENYKNGGERKNEKNEKREMQCNIKGI